MRIWQIAIVMLLPLTLLAQQSGQRADATKTIDSILQTAQLNIKQQEDSAAEKQFAEAMALSEKAGYTKGIATAFRGQARVLQYRGAYLQAAAADSKARDLFQKLGDKDETARSFNDIGVCYFLQGNYPQATSNYLEALKLYEQTRNVTKQAQIQGNIARVYHKTNQYDKATPLILKTIQTYQQLADSNNLASAYLQMGVNSDLRKKGDSALQWYQRANQIFGQSGNLSGKAQSLINMAIVLSDSSRYSESFNMYREALQLFLKLNNIGNILSAQLNMAELYRIAPDSFFVNQGIPVANRLPLAKQLYQSNIQKATETGDTEGAYLAWQGLSQVYEKQAKYQEAYAALQQADSLKEQILDEDKISEIAQQVSRFEYEKQEAVLVAKQEAALSQKRWERNAILAGAGILLAAGAFSFLVYRRNRNAVALQKEAELQTEVAETEMKALRAQMNPHFMFNSLNAIGDYISRNQTGTAQDYLASFAKLMRLVLENSEKKSVCLSDDLKALELYMKLEALRLDQKFSYAIQTSPDIDPDNTYVPPLLLQPFVENSIWHGIAHKEGKGHIQVLIEKEDDMVRCVVEDDGIGRSKAANISKTAGARGHQSLGMQITASRIDVLNKTRKTSAGWQVMDLPTGTRVEIRLPLETD